MQNSKLLIKFLEESKFENALKELNRCITQDKNDPDKVVFNYSLFNNSEEGSSETSPPPQTTSQVSNSHHINQRQEGIQMSEINFQVANTSDVNVQTTNDTNAKGSANGEKKKTLMCLSTKCMINSGDTIKDKENKQEILEHPLVVGIVRHKWRRVGFIIHMINLALYLLFLSTFTACILSTKPTYSTERQEKNYPNNPAFSNDTAFSEGGKEECLKFERNTIPIRNLQYVVIVLSVFSLMKEAYQAFHMKDFSYFRELENYWETGVYVTSILFVVNFSSCQNTGYRMVWQWHIGIISVFFAWINLLFFLKKIDNPFFSGIPISLFVKITKSVLLNVFLVLMVFVTAFGIVFHCMFSYQQGFETVGQSIIKTMAMMIGELDFNTIFTEESTSFVVLGLIFYVVFMLLMAIIMMNIMIGLAVEDVQEMQRSVVAENINLKIRFITHFEPLIKEILKKIKKYCGCMKNAENWVNGQDEETISLQNRSSTKGLPVPKIKDILHILSKEQAQIMGTVDDVKVMLTIKFEEGSKTTLKIKEKVDDLESQTMQSNKTTQEIRQTVGEVQSQIKQSNKTTHEIRQTVGEVQSQIKQSKKITKDIRTQLDTLKSQVNENVVNSLETSNILTKVVRIQSQIQESVEKTTQAVSQLQKQAHEQLEAFEESQRQLRAFDESQRQFLRKFMDEQMRKEERQRNAMSGFPGKLW